MHQIVQKLHNKSNQVNAFDRPFIFEFPFVFTCSVGFDSLYLKLNGFKLIDFIWDKIQLLSKLKNRQIFNKDAKKKQNRTFYANKKKSL